MESVLNLVANGENVRMLVIIAVVCSGYVLMRSQMKDMGYSLNRRIDGVEVSIKELRTEMNGRIDGVESSLNRRIDGVEASIKELKYNDFAHLNNTIEALTYALEKNGTLQKEDKDYVDSRLAH